ncbi:hypothetical protein F5Y08DRAFT_297363 [Xylaria arbuscula]|nr:hypothetical protein F5Y08DRAFT_297363 [Xylaria arbuscula]
MNSLCFAILVGYPAYSTLCTSGAQHTGFGLSEGNNLASYWIQLCHLYGTYGVAPLFTSLHNLHRYLVTSGGDLSLVRPLPPGVSFSSGCMPTESRLRLNLQR